MIARAAGEDESCYPGTTGGGLGRKSWFAQATFILICLYTLTVIWQNMRQRRCSPGDVLSSAVVGATPSSRTEQRLVLTNLWVLNNKKQQQQSEYCSAISEWLCWEGLEEALTPTRENIHTSAKLFIPHLPAMHLAQLWEIPNFYFIHSWFQQQRSCVPLEEY